MKVFGLLILFVLSLSAKAQFNTVTKQVVSSDQLAIPEIPTSKQTSWTGILLTADRQTNYRLRFPLLMMRAQTNLFMGEMYWAGTITTQSYNRGKLGTFYYWDVQGNLRESKFFVDIAGKNKRGLKLVIPRR